MYSELLRPLYPRYKYQVSLVSKGEGIFISKDITFQFFITIKKYTNFNYTELHEIKDVKFDMDKV